MKSKEFLFDYAGVTYPVIITYKSMANTYFRFKDGVFQVTTPYKTSDKRVIEGLNKFAPRLLKRSVKKEAYSFKEGFVYIFGRKYSISKFKDEASLNKYLKAVLLEEVTSEVRELELVMGIKKPYNISVKKMSSRHGSNSRRTHSLAFQLRLVHFTKEIIRSVVVHELCHDKIFNHSIKFYNEVRKYCPNYDELKAKLRKDSFDGK